MKIEASRAQPRDQPQPQLSLTPPRTRERQQTSGMHISTFSRVASELLDTHIAWLPESVQRRETLEVLTISESETSAYIDDLRTELASVREMLHVALRLLADSELRDAKRNRFRDSNGGQQGDRVRAGTAPAQGT